ncbi:sulfatase [Pontiellaceae bacterium B12227]|nr:sulfatase [Pontiellaceae bacterium B12227]
MKRSLIAGAALLVTGLSFAAEETRPNIIWVMSEDMGIDLECYGAVGVENPHLNKMAEEGALFTRAYVANPICSPSRSAMMVGASQTLFDAHHHRSNRNKPIPAPYKPFTVFLREAGYTCILGSDLVMKNGRKIDCNFKHEPTGPYDGVENFGLFDKLDNFTAADQPFFNQIQCVVTHRGDWWNPIRKTSKSPVKLDEIELPPWIADTPETRYDWAAYLDTVEYMDDEVGQILQKVKDEGIADNTYVVFIADNGRCNLRGKGYLQESGIHIPMIVWGPGIKPGTVVDDIVMSTDITATILKLAGAEMPDYLDGHPVFGVEKPVYREYARSARDIWDEVDECSRSISTKKFSYIKNHMPEVPWDAHQAYLDLNRPAIHVMRTLKAEGKLTGAPLAYMAESKPAEELYDNEKDPNQLNNLAGNPEYAEVLKQMRALEKDWQSENNDLGLADLGKRVPEMTMEWAAQTEAGVKKRAPDLWKRLEAGELMETQQFKKYRDDKQKKPKK